MLGHLGQEPVVVGFVALALHVWCEQAFHGFGLFASRLRFDPVLCWAIARLGIAAGMLVGLESGLFAAVSVLSGVIGAKALAAHQIVLGWSEYLSSLRWAWRKGQ